MNTIFFQSVFYVSAVFSVCDAPVIKIIIALIPAKVLSGYLFFNNQFRIFNLRKPFNVKECIEFINNLFLIRQDFLYRPVWYIVSKNKGEITVGIPPFAVNFDITPSRIKTHCQNSN